MNPDPSVATVLLTHEKPAAVSAMCAYWKARDPDQRIVVAYGGTREDFANLDVESSVFVDDPFLRTKDHPREKQSYLEVFRATLPVVREWGSTHVHVAEYDEIPVVDGMSAHLLGVLASEKADVIGHRLCRVDGTGHPHYAFHRSEPEFHEYWRAISRRENKDVVLSMLGCGSFWARAAFENVANLRPPVKIYLELMLPTAAHHLGFRVRPIPGHDPFMGPEVLKTEADFDHYRSLGAWRIHPVKGFWTKSKPA